MRTLTAAVVQASAPLFDTPAALAKAERLIRSAVVDHGARVVVLPEAFLGGYPKGLDFGITVGSRTAEGRELFRRYHAAAVEVPGPEVDALATLTRELGVHAVVGAVERRGGTLYCVALHLGPEGFLGLRRKLMPTAAERYLWGQGDGSTLEVVRTGEATIGTAICYDYESAALWNNRAGDLWHTFTVYLRRHLAEAAEVSRSKLGTVLRMEFAKVAEYQSRGLVHFHAVIRLDGPAGPDELPPFGMDTDTLTEAITITARATQVSAGDHTLRWGKQLDIRPIAQHPPP
ncbi:replication initiator [Actinokineospora bangkokensis]|uniref:replication initiator n=1 Tax=Actinokineospora bangkokensis TaxID=1193682 RepID=UPI000A031169|nr:replication initiator [Actinokineospora bangkokensis]